MAPYPGDIRDALHKGELIVYPTDTLYALGASIHSAEGVSALYTMKGLSNDHPLSIAFHDSEPIGEYAVINDTAERAIDLFLPGPITIIIPAKEARPPLWTDTIGVRVPAHLRALELLEVTGPLTATSANLHDQHPSVTVEEARAHFHDDVAFYINGGTMKGTPSTIINIDSDGDYRIVREGAISGDLIRERL